MADLITLAMRDRREWRAWLKKNHASSPGIWLTFFKGTDAPAAVCYEDSVREALCFGWIDSLIKRIDGERYVRKFTPRKPDSVWSDLNRKRWAELKAGGLLEAPGLAAAPTDKMPAAASVPSGLPDYFANALRTNPKALASFDALAPCYRRNFIGWVHTAKRQETREARLREAIALLARGEKLGMK